MIPSDSLQEFVSGEAVSCLSFLSFLVISAMSVYLHKSQLCEE